MAKDAAQNHVEAMLGWIPDTEFPRVLDATFVAERVFTERDVNRLTDHAETG